MTLVHTTVWIKCVDIDVGQRTQQLCRLCNILEPRFVVGFTSNYIVVCCSRSTTSNFTQWGRFYLSLSSYGAYNCKEGWGRTFNIPIARVSNKIILYSCKKCNVWFLLIDSGTTDNFNLLQDFCVEYKFVLLRCVLTIRLTETWLQTIYSLWSKFLTTHLLIVHSRNKVKWSVSLE